MDAAESHVPCSETGIYNEKDGILETNPFD